MIYRYKLKFEEIFYQIPKSSLVLLSVGEIDCRIDEGIMRVLDNSPKVKLNELILKTVTNYINYVIKLNRELNHTIIIQGVPSLILILKIITWLELDSSQKLLKLLIET